MGGPPPGRRRGRLALLGGLPVLALAAAIAVGQLDRSGAPAGDEVALPTDVTDRQEDDPDGDDGADAEPDGDDGDAEGAGAEPEPGFSCLVDDPCVRWRADVRAVQGDPGRDWVSVHPADDGGLVVVGTAGIMGLTPDGRQRWMTSRDGTTADPFAGVQVLEGVVVEYAAGQTVAREPSSGERRWTTEAAHPEGVELVLRDATLAGDTVVLLLAREGSDGEEEPVAVRGHALDDGSLRWEHTGTGERVMLGAQLAAVSDDRELRVLDGGSGEVRWRTELPWSVPEHPDVPDDAAAAAIAVAHDSLVLLSSHPMAGGEPDLRVHDAATGEELERYAGHVQRGSFFVAPGQEAVPLVTTAGPESEILMLDDDGTPAWSLPMSSASDDCCGRALAGDEVVILTSTRPGGPLRVHARDDGRLLREIEQPELPHDPGTALDAETVLVPRMQRNESEHTVSAFSLRDAEELWAATPHGMTHDEDGTAYLPVGDEVVAVPFDPRGAD